MEQILKEANSRIGPNVGELMPAMKVGGGVGGRERVCGFFEGGQL